MKNIIKKDFQIYAFFDNLDLAKDKEKYIKLFLDKFDDLNLKYKNREKLEEEITYSIFGEDETKDYFKVKEDKIKEMLEIIEEVMLKIKKFGKEKTNIFLLPTFDHFIEKDLGGVTGHCFVNNFIFLFINPKGNWQTKLKETLAHEFAHSVSPYYLVDEPTLGTCLISEGLAEHFREAILGGEIAPYSKSINEEEIKKYLKVLEKSLESKSEELYFDVFFGSKDFPKWMGYSVGYYIIKKYLEDKTEIDWYKLLRINPNKILNEVLKQNQQSRKGLKFDKKSLSHNFIQF